MPWVLIVAPISVLSCHLRERRRARKEQEAEQTEHAVNHGTARLRKI